MRPMRIVSFEPGDPMAARYEKFLAETGQGLFQTPAWAAAKARDGWRPRGLAAVAGDAIYAGVIALERRLPGGLLPFGGIWHAPRGPVARFESEQGRAAADALFGALDALAADSGGSVIRISPDVAPGGLPAGWLASRGYRPAPGAPWMHTATFRVDLARPEDAVLAGMEGRTRSAIRKAGRAGIRIDASNGADSFRTFYAMHRDTGARNAFRVISEKRMHALWEESGKGNWGRVFISRAPGGEALSAALVLAAGSRCHYLFGASAPGCRQWHPNELLHWEVMKWARARGCRVYDLEGVAGRLSRGHPLWGNYLFKRGFGGDYVELAGEYERVLQPRVHRMIAWGVGRLRSVRASAPKAPRRGEEASHA